jgi:hypothetical protein
LTGHTADAGRVILETRGIAQYQDVLLVTVSLNRLDLNLTAFRNIVLKCDHPQQVNLGFSCGTRRSILASPGAIRS